MGASLLALAKSIYYHIIKIPKMLGYQGYDYF